MNTIAYIFQNYSVTQVTNFAKILASILLMFQIDVNEGDLTQFLLAIFVIGSSVISVVNRYAKGDLKILGSRRKPLV